MSEIIDELDDLENQAYHLMFRLNFSEAEAATTLEAELSDLGQNPFLAELAVVEALSYRHQQAVRGEFDWMDWAKAVARKPAESGADVWGLALVSALAAFFVIWTVGSEMRGPHLVIKLLLEGLSLATGVIVFGVGSIPLYWMKSRRTRAQKDSRRSLPPPR